MTARRAEDEALRWLVDLDDLSESGQAHFHAWLCERPENLAAFEKVEIAWRRLDVVRQLVSNTANDTPDLDIVNKWLWRRRLRRRYLPLAAVAGVAAIAVALFSLLSADYEASYRTDIGQHEEILLPDNSVVTLNTNSTATVYYNDEERRVHLHRGEAHFVIVPAPGRPFSVVAGSGTVRAVGTAFNVYLKDDLVEVTVTEGIVEVRANANPAPALDEQAEADTRRASAEDVIPVGALVTETLGEGQRLEYRKTIQSVYSVEPEEIARKLAWQDGMLDFQGEALPEVIAEASRYTSTQIEIDDPELEDLNVTGYFRAGDVDTLLELIESNERVAVRRVTPSLVRITAKRD